MDTPLLRNYLVEDFEEIVRLFPVDWKFDFRKFINIHHGKDYFRAVSVVIDSKPAGFANLMIFGKTAWLGNIVIKEELRNQGLGTVLTNHLLTEGKKLGIKTFTLIATKLGEPVYKKLNFKRLLQYEFYRPTENTPCIELPAITKTASIDDVEGIVEMDMEVSGENRKKLLSEFYSETKIISHPNGSLRGFYMKNLGNGLIIAREPLMGIELLKYQVNGLKNVVINEKNNTASQFLLDCGYEKYMESPRMILGEQFQWKPEFIFCRGAGYSG